MELTSLFTKSKVEGGCASCRNRGRLQELGITEQQVRQALQTAGARLNADNPDVFGIATEAVDVVRWETFLCPSCRSQDVSMTIQTSRFHRTPSRF